VGAPSGNRRQWQGANGLHGAQALIEDKNIHWIVVGELHGTAQSPEVFADLVCRMEEAAKPISP